VVVAERAPPPVAAGAAGETPPTARFAEELVVRPSRLSLLGESPRAVFGLRRDELEAVPHLGADLFRAVTLLPGATSNDVSAQFHVRGARRDETRIVLDGQELYDAYHLQDYDRALSVLAPTTLDSAELSTAGFSAEDGDRMSGVLDLVTRAPERGALFRGGLGVWSVDAGGLGRFACERAGWLVELRRGTTDLVGRLLQDEDPQYWDSFAKLSFRLSERHELAGSFLHAGDELKFEQTIEELRKRFETAYFSSYVWLEERALLRSDLAAETSLSLAKVDRDRNGAEIEEASRFVIVDERDLDVYELRQLWRWAPGRHAVSFGGGRRRFDAAYDYDGVRVFDDPLARIRHDFGRRRVVFADRFVENDDHLFVSDQVALGERLAAELGARYDRHGVSDSSHVSPRLGLALSASASQTIRLAWGRFLQSQRPYELMVEDGDTTFHPVERAEHRVLGYERRFDDGALAGGAVRLELYERTVSNPRPRYENLYEPLNTFPEIEPDRVRTAPERSRARGVELFFQGPTRERWRAWGSYTWAESEDGLEGAWIPRLYDERHALKLDLDRRLGARWRLNLAWRFHTGWPTTPLDLEAIEDEEGEIEYVPRLGRRNSARLADYHRLDLRLSRELSWRGARYDLYVDVQNVYNRENAAGFDYEIDEEAGTIRSNPESWAGILPSAGIRVEF
jgi:outer membrane receptor protein involved in Fe transport